MSEQAAPQRSEAQVREDTKLMSQEQFDAKREEYLDGQAAMRQKYGTSRHATHHSKVALSAQ